MSRHRNRTSDAALAAAALGLVAGGMLGASAGLGLLLALGGTDRVALGWGLGVLCAAYGAVLGLVLAPVTKLLLLPDVPLHRAAWTTFAGASMGVALGCMLGPHFRIALAWPVGVGLLGFAAAVLGLRYGRWRAPGSGRS